MKYEWNSLIIENIKPIHKLLKIASNNKSCQFDYGNNGNRGNSRRGQDNTMDLDPYQNYFIPYQ